MFQGTTACAADPQVAVKPSVLERHFPFQPGRIAPEILKAVEGTLVSVKDVDNDLQVIEHHPLAGRKSVDRYRSK